MFCGFGVLLQILSIPSHCFPYKTGFPDCKHSGVDGAGKLGAAQRSDVALLLLNVGSVRKPHRLQGTEQ